MEHLYTNQTHPYYRAPHIYIATAARFMPKRQVLTEDGKRAEGFELENSKELIGNEIKKAVNWQDNPDLKQFMNKPVRLRFVMKDADLYSLKFD